MRVRRLFALIAAGATRLIDREVDVLVLGSSFNGSLAALILSRLGYRVAVIDRAAHPRFAIGESSTPAADLVLASLCRRFEIPRIAELCNYGEWKRCHPEIDVGLKRGFSFFRHRPGVECRPGSDGTDQLLVAASLDDRDSDTHWMRSDVDHFFAGQLSRAGIEFHELCAVQSIGREHDGRVTVQSLAVPDSSATRWKCKLLVDSTGAAGEVARQLGLEDLPRETFKTSTMSVFGHFRGLCDWNTLFPTESCIRHPFSFQHAAIHHVIDEGWIWQLPFDSGITSCGVVLDLHAPQAARLSRGSAAETWNHVVRRYPTLRRQFATARCVTPPNGPCKTDRLQRGWSQLGGDGWVMLPGTAGFVDPLFSTGIAQSLCGLEHLADQWERDGIRPGDCWQTYSNRVTTELRLIDRLIAMTLRHRDDFSRFTQATMLYFLLAVHWEHQRAAGIRQAFLCTDDEVLMKLVDEAERRLACLEGQHDDRAVGEYRTWFLTAAEPFNWSGLNDLDVGNMYRYTAAPRWRPTADSA